MRGGFMNGGKKDPHLLLGGHPRRGGGICGTPVLQFFNIQRYVKRFSSRQ